MITGQLELLGEYKEIILYAETISAFARAGQWSPVGEWLELTDRLKVIRLRDWNRSNEFELHRKYADLHLTLKGVDKMRACFDASDLAAAKPYDMEKDFALFNGVADIEMMLKRGCWAFIAPGEPHRNEFMTGDTEKLVFKILVV